MDGAVGRVLRPGELAAYRGAPLIVFVGISTAGSSVHRVHPAWAPLLGPGTELRGLDLPETVRPDELRRVVSDLCANPAIHGAVVTSHKLRIFGACHELLDASDPLAGLTHEFNCLDVSGEPRAYARDPLSLATILDPGGSLGTENVVCVGAGGAATALLLAVCLDVGASLEQSRPVLRPSRRQLTVVGRTASSLAALRTVCERLGLAEDAVPLVLTSGADEVAAIVAGAPAGSLIVNATGLGKTSVASPLPDATAFPERAVAWDFKLPRAADVPAAGGRGGAAVRGRVGVLRCRVVGRIGRHRGHPVHERAAAGCHQGLGRVRTAY
ncbi:hypothetical protein ACQHIV_19240 [Kribbella sp. GL6]|uniref:hypothetical protein n=1 Tax=Kribbella sp. GL6 TaxID=3419765 RepID=UPI003D078ACD